MCEVKARSRVRLVAAVGLLAIGVACSASAVALHAAFAAAVALAVVAVLCVAGSAWLALMLGRWGLRTVMSASTAEVVARQTLVIEARQAPVLPAPSRPAIEARVAKSVYEPLAVAWDRPPWRVVEGVIINDRRMVR